MDPPSIYADLSNTDLGERVEKLKERNEKLFKHIQTLEGDVEKLCKELMKMKRTEDNLKNNISSLYKTSKIEIERKDRMIAELRRELDDLLFRRFKTNSTHKGSEEQRVPSGIANFNKRGSDSIEPEPIASKKQKREPQDESRTETNKPQPVLPAKNGINHETTARQHKSSSRSYSKSPPKQEKGSSRYRSRDRKRSRSRSKGRHHNLSCTRSRERERDRSRNRKHIINDKNDKYRGRDLRQVLSTRKSKKETNFNSDKNCNTVIKEALTRISNKHDNRSSENISGNSNGKNSAGNKVLEARNDGKQNYGVSLDNKLKTNVTTTGDKNSCPENKRGITNKSHISTSIHSQKGGINVKFKTENMPLVTKETEKLEPAPSQIHNHITYDKKEVRNCTSLEMHHNQIEGEACLDKIAKTEENLQHVNSTSDSTNVSDKIIKTINKSKESTSESKVAESLQISGNDITETSNTNGDLVNDKSAHSISLNDINNSKTGDLVNDKSAHSISLKDINNSRTGDLVNDKSAHSISLNDISISRTSINPSRRRRCVIKIVS